mgnify:CR=1 FL=1
MAAIFSAEVERGLNVEANQPFLAQALANVIDNAIKYTPTGGAVMLRARRRSSGDIEYSVTDTGPGVPAAAADRVFDSFTQADETISRRHGGAGLGLTISRALARQMEGDLTLEDGDGGAAFVFTLLAAPIAAPTVKPAAAASAAVEKKVEAVKADAMKAAEPAKVAEAVKPADAAKPAEAVKAEPAKLDKKPATKVKKAKKAPKKAAEVKAAEAKPAEAPATK